MREVNYINEVAKIIYWLFWICVSFFALFFMFAFIIAVMGG
jgi:hypothetical protein